MSLTFKLYISTADYRRVNKIPYLTLVGSERDLNPTEEVNLINPRIVLKYTSGLENVNYAQCVETGRYYFMNNPVVDAGNRIIFHGLVDVRMNDLSGVTAFITKGGMKNKFSDSNFPIPESNDMRVIKWEHSPHIHNGKVATSLIVQTI